MRISDWSSDVVSSVLFGLTLPATLVVLVLAMFGHYFPRLPVDTRTWIELVLTIPVVLWAGWPFFVRCVQSVRNLSPNMWTLIGIGVGAAFGYSIVATIAPDLFPESFHEHGRVGRSEERPVGKECVETG